MKWALEADDYGNIFHMTMIGGQVHRRPINVGDDVSGESALILAAAAETWTEEVIRAANERRAEHNRRDAAMTEHAEQVRQDAEAAADAEFEARAERLGYVRKTTKF